MNKNRFARQLVVAAGLFFLSAAPGLTRAQSSPPVPLRAPRMVSPAPRPKGDTGPVDDLAGLKFTDDQQAKIDQIHQNMKLRMDTVVKDEKLTKEQKGAMLEGLERMERGQVYRVLTPEQLKEVRKVMLARRAAEQETKQKPSPPK